MPGRYPPPFPVTPRVLFVDDNVDTAESFATILAGEGFDVRCAFSGAQALEAIREWTPHAACIDLMMPAMDGFQLAARLPGACEAAPVLIAVTGVGGADVVRKCAQAGFVERVLKPCDPNALVSSLRRWIVDPHPEEVGHPFLSERLPDDVGRLAQAALDAAMDVARADKGNVQLLDGEGVLRIRAQRGFDEPFLRHFAAVSTASTSACGAALRRRSQVFVDDVEMSSIFEGDASRRSVLEAGVRSLVCTPLLDDAGAVRGVVSCHYLERNSVEGVNLPALRVVARRLASGMPDAVPQ